MLSSYKEIHRLYPKECETKTLLGAYQHSVKPLGSVQEHVPIMSKANKATPLACSCRRLKVARVHTLKADTAHTVNSGLHPHSKTNNLPRKGKRDKTYYKLIADT